MSLRKEKKTGLHRTDAYGGRTPKAAGARPTPPPRPAMKGPHPHKALPVPRGGEAEKAGRQRLRRGRQSGGEIRSGLRQGLGLWLHLPEGGPKALLLRSGAEKRPGP